jgi:signal transduction histidine kinase/ActR/RegA family two-component response regulator
VSADHAHSPGDRVLLLALTAKDAAVAKELLAAADIHVEACETFEALLHELESGAAVLALAEEKVSVANSARLATVLREQPPWSDLPVLMFTRQGADSPMSRDAVRTLGNVTLLERPLRVTALLSAVRSALRARQRQYQIRAHLEEREQAAEALRVADQRKDEFLATLGHELRNPLAPLLTGLHLLKMTSNRDPGVARITAVMERQLTHLVRLVDDLLEVSRITRGVIDVQREPLDLATLVRAALETTRPMFEAAGHQLSMDLPSAPITIQGDSVRLTQVFANLLTNAAKYTNAGGRISVTVKRSGERAEITVRDNGIGIPPDHLDSVFDMFMQVDRSNRRSQGGLGIGLTLVRSLVSMHGGTVQAHSAGPGHGSEFVVTLPVAAAQAVGAAQPRSLAMFPPRRVLVVDDNQDAADTLGSLLTALGATVAVVHGGAEALEAFGAFKPDTVLLDIGMPGMDGYDVARRIRATESHPDTLLIALTGWGQDHDYRQSRAAGFDHHLVKPPDIEQLRELLIVGWNPPSPGAEVLTDDPGSPRTTRH